MKQKKVDVLAVGAHPDDVELGCGGLLLKAKKEGLTTGILILTDGAAGRSGSAETRAAEASEAARILQADHFKMLGLPDGGLISDLKTRELAAKEIALCRPSLIITHYRDETHPDHMEAHEIVNKASFLSMSRKFSPTPYRGPLQTFYYCLNPEKLINPDLIVDISEVYALKREALSAHKSQSSVIASFESMAKLYGNLCATQYAEAFMLKSPLKIDNFKSLIMK